MGHENVVPKPGKLWTILTVLIAGLSRLIWMGQWSPNDLILNFLESLFLELKEQGKKRGPTWHAIRQL